MMHLGQPVDVVCLCCSRQAAADYEPDDLLNYCYVLYNCCVVVLVYVVQWLRR